MNVKTIEHMLLEATEIIKKHEDIKVNSGELFNLLEVSGINTDEVKNGKIKFTVKDHNQFKGIKQTVVTRCKLSA